MALEFQHSTKNPLYPVTYLSFYAMHTRIEMVAVGLDECAGRELAQSVEAEVKRLERIFNRFDEGLGGEVFSTLTGIKGAAPQIYGVGAVLNRGLQGLHGPGRGQ